jgi:hypothetical protein
MGVLFRRAILPLSNLLPEALLRPLLRWSLGETRVALCLHRVSSHRLGDSLLTIHPREIDRFIEMALRARPGKPWLTICFDDGYADAAEYVKMRAPRFPSVEWLFFVCPEKVEQRAGFRWDLGEHGAARRSGRTATTLGPIDIDSENSRPDLKAVARRADYRLADVATCRDLAGLPNLQLGNHTNCHYWQMLFGAEEASKEYENSARDFRRLFGVQQHFAFPFGTPELEFSATHVRLLRRLGSFLIWSTEARPYRAWERVPGAVLPRFSVDGSWTSSEIALWIAACAVRYRVRGTRHKYPLTSEATASHPPSLPGATGTWPART